MSTTIQVRVDDELKRQSDSLFKALGTDTTSAIRMFLTQAATLPLVSSGSASSAIL